MTQSHPKSKSKNSPRSMLGRQNSSNTERSSPFRPTPGARRRLDFLGQIPENDMRMSGTLTQRDVHGVSSVAKMASNNSSPLVPKDLFLLFDSVNKRSDQLSPNGKRQLEKAHSITNSILSSDGNLNSNRIQRLWNVEETLIKLQNEVDSKKKQSVEQIRTISQLEKDLSDITKKLERSRERHSRATAMIKELVSEENVPIIKQDYTSTREVNRLAKEMETMKGVSDAERSKLLALIVSLTKKQRNIRNSMSKLKNIAVVKQRDVSSLESKMSNYDSKIKEYESVIRRIKQNKPTSVKQQTPVRTITRSNVEQIIRNITNAKVPTTPPGITKTNVERILAPFKQPITVTVAPTISVKAGSAKASAMGGSVMQLISKNMFKKPEAKKKPMIIDPVKMRDKTMSANKYREIVRTLRTPTRGQRKMHVINLIDRVLKSMKVPKDIEKKLVHIYDKSMTEKQIKALFGGRTREDVRSILKKQVEYLSKKR